MAKANWARENTGCAYTDIAFFAEYIRENKPKGERTELQEHLEGCVECKLNFAYVEEILAGNHSLSLDEQTLLLRYTCDPLWALISESTRKRIKKEILAELKDIVKSSSSVDAKTPVERRNAWHFKYKIAKTVITLLFVFALTINIFVVYHHYSAKRLATLITVTGRQNPFYKQLDNLIDNYLETSNANHLSEAEKLAEMINQKYADKYPSEIVNFYKKLPTSDHSDLLYLRKRLSELQKTPSGDNYRVLIAETSFLKERLLTFNAQIEALKADIVISRFSVLSREKDKTYRENISRNLGETLKKGYFFLHLHFQLWKAKDGEATHETRQELEAIVLEANRLGVEEVRVSAGISLAGTYCLLGESEAAIGFAESILLTADLKYANSVTLLQVLGVSHFQLKNFSQAESYFDQSIILSEKYKNNYQTALSNAFLATMLSEEGKFSQASEAFLRAETLALLVNDDFARLDISARITGYKAKDALTRQDYHQAKILYQKTLKMFEELKSESVLEIAQVNQGLALSLKDNPESREYLARASFHFHRAKAMGTTGFCLFSFIPDNCR